MNILDALKLDGRVKMPEVETGWPRVKVASTPTVSSIRRVIQSFESSGNSSHSGAAVTLKYVLAYCEAKNIPYTLERTVIDGRCDGYFVERGLVSWTPSTEYKVGDVVEPLGEVVDVLMNGD